MFETRLSTYAPGSEAEKLSHDRRAVTPRISSTFSAAQHLTAFVAAAWRIIIIETCLSTYAPGCEAGKLSHGRRGHIAHNSSWYAVRSDTANVALQNFWKCLSLPLAILWGCLGGHVPPDLWLAHCLAPQLFS